MPSKHVDVLLKEADKESVSLSSSVAGGIAHVLIGKVGQTQVIEYSQYSAITI